MLIRNPPRPLEITDYEQPGVVNRALDRSMIFCSRSNILDIDRAMMNTDSGVGRGVAVAKILMSVSAPRVRAVMAGGLLEHLRFECVYRRQLEIELSN